VEVKVRVSKGKGWTEKKITEKKFTHYFGKFTSPKH
jgi:hypothetical protein